MCDTLVVRWGDRVGFAKNSDRDPNEAQHPEWRPAGDHPKGATLRCTWRRIPQVRRTHAVLLSRPFWSWGAEMGANACGLVIGNEAVFTTQPYEEAGLTGLDLVRLGLERAADVDEAVEVISTLIRAYGQGGRAGYSSAGFQYHNSFLLADRHGAVVLEAAGREVQTERVRGGARAISNGLTLPSMQKYADPIRGRVARCGARRRRMEALGGASQGPRGLASALRDHGDGVDVPAFHRLNGAMAAPCMHYGGWLAGSQTVSSWISELGPDGARHWITGTAAPCLSIFRPVRLDQPREVGRPQGRPDGESLWWRFERVHRLINRDPGASMAMREARDRLEAEIFASPEAEDAHWEAADRWLSEWKAWVEANPPVERRPRWLVSRWEGVEAEAAEGNRLPPR